ncbi:MAG: hypothetical protein OXC61_06875 [Flavobacteriaceae bacterium]|nr:hypothetical protein [Flavobacteriaceae bacterium]
MVSEVDGGDMRTAVGVGRQNYKKRPPRGQATHPFFWFGHEGGKTNGRKKIMVVGDEWRS